MPIFHCSVLSCNNNSISVRKEKRVVQFYTFPKDPICKRRWIQFTERGNAWRPNLLSQICSEHFTEDSYEKCYTNANGNRVRTLKSTAIPTIQNIEYLGYETDATECESSVIRNHDPLETLRIDELPAHDNKRQKLDNTSSGAFFGEYLGFVSSTPPKENCVSPTKNSLQNSYDDFKPPNIKRGNTTILDKINDNIYNNVQNHEHELSDTEYDDSTYFSLIEANNSKNLNNYEQSPAQHTNQLRAKLDRLQNNVIDILNEIKSIKDDLQFMEMSPSNHYHSQQINNNNISKNNKIENEFSSYFPMKTAGNFEKFEMLCRQNEDMQRYLVQKYNSCRETDCTKFIHYNLRNLLTENAAFPLSWNGQYGKIAIKDYIVMRLLKNCARENFRTSTEEGNTNDIKRWFWK